MLVMIIKVVKQLVVNMWIKHLFLMNYNVQMHAQMDNM